MPTITIGGLRSHVRNRELLQCYQPDSFLVTWRASWVAHSKHAIPTPLELIGHFDHALAEALRDLE